MHAAKGTKKGAGASVNSSDRLDDLCDTRNVSHDTGHDHTRCCSTLLSRLVATGLYSRFDRTEAGWGQHSNRAFISC